MIYTNLKETNQGKHGMWESSNLKSTDVGNLYDCLVRDGEDHEIDIDNGVALAVGEYTGNGLQERYATIAKTTDKIAVTGAVALIKDAFTTAQAQPYNFYTPAGKLVKTYEILKDDIFAVASYQFTNEDEVAFGKYVVIDGNGLWTIQNEEPTGVGFVGKVHSLAVGNFYTMVRIQCVKNDDAN